MSHYCAGPRVDPEMPLEEMESLLQQKLKSRCDPSEVQFLGEIIRDRKADNGIWKFRRLGCGQNVDKIIEELPLGEEQKFPCPKCGNEITVTRL